jgi:hypothetical protein
MTKKLLLTCLLLLATGFVLADKHGSEDWRKAASDREKLQNLIKVMPGTSTIMVEMGERYRNLYWAGQQDKWEFAEYQLEEIESLIETLMITRPARAATSQDFLDQAMKPLETAIENKNKSAFLRGFDNLHQQCMTCHKRNDHAFIVLPAKPAQGNSLVLEVK